MNSLLLLLVVIVIVAVAWRVQQQATGVDPRTRNRTLSQLGNNRQVVDRLLKQARLKYPGKSEQWYWEKVLYDIERDR
jgi:hypothetical protein